MNELANQAGAILSTPKHPDSPILKLVTLMYGHGDRNHTSGKRSYFRNGELMDVKYHGVEYCELHADEAYYEGEGNREIGAELEKIFKKNGIRYEVINQGNKDMSRMQRCSIANAYAQRIGKQVCLNIAIHSDAFRDPNAHGWSCYTSPGFTTSDIYATALYQEAEKMWPDEEFRTSLGDGDPDKEAKFTVLTETIAPAILPENFFFTNYQDFIKHLKTRQGKREIAQVIFNMVKRFYYK